MTLRERTGWSQIIAITVALVVGGLGLAVATLVLTDPSVWRSFFWYAGWGLVLLGFILPLWRGWPDLWPRAALKRERTAHHETQVRCDKLRDDLQQQILTEQSKVREAQASRGQLERQRDSALDELKREKEAHRQTAVERDTLAEKERYGIDPQKFVFDDLTANHLDIAYNDMARVRGSLDTAFNSAVELTLGLLGEAANGDRQVKEAAQHFQEVSLRRTQRLYHRLAESMDGLPREDYRRWLAYYYEAYNELRITIVQLSRLLNRPLASVNGYRGWRPVDKEFLKGILDIGVMRRIIEGINGRSGYPLDLRTQESMSA